MLFKTLDAIRQKPKPVRDQYALLFAVVCTLVIGGVWSISLPSRLDTVGVASVSTASTTVPFGGLWAEFRSKFSSAPPPSATAVVSTTTPSAEYASSDALDLQLRTETISQVNAVSTTTPPPVTILIATTTATSTD